MGSAPMDGEQVTDLQLYLSASVCEVRPQTQALKRGRLCCEGEALPLEPSLFRLLSACELYGLVAQGWGMTETGIAFLQDSSDGDKGTIGGPLAAVEFKVASVPSLNYDARADPPR